MDSIGSMVWSSESVLNHRGSTVAVAMVPDKHVARNCYRLHTFVKNKICVHFYHCQIVFFLLAQGNIAEMCYN